MAKEQAFYIGIKALIQNKESQYLLLQANVARNHPEGTPIYWDIPGGRIDEGEGLLDTLAREIHEETGLSSWKGEPEQLTTVISNHKIERPEGVYGLALVVYRVTIPDDAQIAISEEHSTYEWVDRDVAAERLSNKYPKEFTAVL
ncbi:MAG TPA: NUDIX domain-containing protein [Candidatus Saccharimonadales bacterium]